MGSRRLLALVLGASLALVAQRSLADVPGPSAGSLVPPKLEKYVEPVYPKEKLAKGEKATVVLELVVDANGKVTDAKITESAGTDFDDAAIVAAKQLVFQPATRDGKPIVAKIPFRFTFDFKDVAKVEDKKADTPAKPVVVLSGVVRTAGDEALAGATVKVLSSKGTIVSTITDEHGHFAFADLPIGKYAVSVDAAGFVPFEAEEEIVKDTITQVVYRPKLASEGIDVVVKGERPPREVTKRVLDLREVSRIPGTNGDALRAVQSMPGVARPPGFAGLLVIRGSGPQDTNIFVDGTIIPLVYHFGGLSSVIPTELLERIDFFPGNFGPEYGRVMGGIIDVGVRSPTKEKFKGLLQLDLIDGRFVIEGPIDDKTRFAAAGRRSWVDVWLKPVLEEMGAGVSTAPVYYDYQLMLERDLGATTTARAFFFGSDDRLAITLNNPSDSDPSLGGGISAHTAFYRLQFRAETRLKDITFKNMVSIGHDTIDFTIGPFFFNGNVNIVDVRSDVRAKISKEATFIVGFDMYSGAYEGGIHVPALDPYGDQTDGPFFARPITTLKGSGYFARPAGYVLLDLAPTRALKLLPGVRVDYTRDTASWDVSPRFAARYDLVPEFPKTTLKGGVGVFMQPPQPNESILPFGTPGIGANRAVHYGAGFEQQLAKNVDVSLDGFYKDLQHLVTLKLTENATESGLTYANTGSGRVYGAEILLRYRPDSRFFGWLAYTLSRSERRNAPGDPLYTFTFDQTHILTVLGSFKLGRGWEAGARFRYVSGSMYTPYLGGIVDFDAGAYEPIPGAPFSRRLPPFHQLDVRIDKQWTFSGFRLSAYLDVQNVYNRGNPEGVSYNYNFQQQGVVSGLPILPILGLRGEL